MMYINKKGRTMVDRSLNFGRHLVEQFLSLSMPFSSVLDIGAGDGGDLEIARKMNPEAKQNAIECYEPSVKSLRGKGINVAPLNIERDKFPYADGSMDVIIANQILEHTKEIFWIFHEISRTLPVGGKAIIGVPNLASLHNRILLAIGRQPSQIKSCSAHVRGFTKQDILHFLESCFPGGYELKKSGGSNFYPFPPSIARPLANVFPNMAWGLFLLLEKKREYNGEFISYPSKNSLETNFFVG